MDFRLTDEQTLLVDTARSLFTRECPPTSSAGGRRADGGVRPVRPAPPRLGGAGGRALGRPLPVPRRGRRGRRARTVPVHRRLLRPAAPRRGHPLADDAVAGAVTGTVAVAAGPDGRLRAADLELVDKVALVVDGSRLTSSTPSAVEARPVKTLDLARSMSFVTVPEGIDFQPLEEAP